MKTKHVIPALSLALLLIGMTVLFAKPISSPNPLDQTKHLVTYVVYINHGDHLAGFNCDYYIMVTDERGNPVASPQQFRLGQWTYQVKELGPVTGTRIAKIVRNPHMICPNAYNFAPVSLSDTFKGGAFYLFTMTPIETNVSSSGD